MYVAKEVFDTNECFEVFDSLTQLVSITERIKNSLPSNALQVW